MFHVLGAKVAALVGGPYTTGNDNFVHAAVVIVVVLCATGLAAGSQLDHGTVGNIFAAAIGYAAGRSGTTTRQQRDTDTPTLKAVPDELS